MPRETSLDLLKRTLIACTRAIADAPELDVVFSKSNPLLNGNIVRLPELLTAPTSAALPAIRGTSDAMALRRACHDAGLHQRFAPQGTQARAIFDALEQARVEAIGARRMLGVSDNLAAMLEDRFDRAYLGAVQEKADAPLDEAIALMVRERLTGLPPPKSGERIVELWRDRVEGQLGAALDMLPSYVDNQDAFARHVLQILDSITSASCPLLTDRDAEGEENKERGGERASRGGERPAKENEILGSEEKENESYEAATVGRMADLDEQSLKAPHAARAPEHAADHATHETGYHVFTTQYDEVINAGDLCDPQELNRLRAILDKRLVLTQRIVGRLAHRLQRRLMALQNRYWDFDQEEGVLDSARLSRLIIDPTQSLSFKQERDSHFRDTVVTLLIDNSGSMHGRPIATAAICADILSRTLELCGVRVEILGFTTSAWRGGQAREAWLKAGKPAHPGRLSDVRHIIYKSADQPWRRARRNLGLMMCEELLKENIDGEALLWAHQRLVVRPEQRKILVMIADGAPADDSTLAFNPANYLARHLHAVIGMIQKSSPVELLAIGIGHDVTRYYDRAVTITDAEELANAMTDQLAKLFDEGGRPHQSNVKSQASSLHMLPL